MKKTIFSLLLAMVVLAIPAVDSAAQVVRIDKDIFNGKRFINSAADSVLDISLYYEGSTFPEIRGQLPDSIRISWFASDSISGDLYFKAKRSNGAYTRNLVDSIKAVETDFKQVTATQFTNSFDVLAVVFAARATGNDESAGNRLFMRLERYFTKP